jgi:hypothetical protein
VTGSLIWTKGSEHIYCCVIQKAHFSITYWHPLPEDSPRTRSSGLHEEALLATAGCLCSKNSTRSNHEPGIVNFGSQL